MSSFQADYRGALAVAHAHAVGWTDELAQRRIPPQADIDAVKDALGRELPATGEGAAAVVALLAEAAAPGLMAMGSPRFYGWVIGGAQPAALGADWLTSTWDQNSALRATTPGVVAAEELAAEWILDLLGLPREADVGFVTGATMANFTCLVAARDTVLRRVGWDTATNGLAGGARVRLLVGAQRHDTIDHAARMAGLGEPRAVECDDQGRIVPAALEAALADGEGPAIVALQAGNVHSGAFDPMTDAIGIAHAAGAWVHVDGAFGLWAAASPRTSHLVAGVREADSWTTDTHKTLSVPYDCGVAIVADGAALRAAMGMSASYLAETASTTHADPQDRVPELSRRARGVPTWAALRAMGRSGTAALVDRLTVAATRIAAELAALPSVSVLNDVVFTQVCVALDDDQRTAAWADALREDGEVYASSSRWRDRAVLRFSVSNWATDDSEVDRTIAAATRALERALGQAPRTDRGHLS